MLDTIAVLDRRWPLPAQSAEQQRQPVDTWTPTRCLFMPRGSFVATNREFGRTGAAPASSWRQQTCTPPVSGNNLQSFQAGPMLLG